MKVRRKHVHIREDCFAADERGTSVTIQAYRNRVQVRAMDATGATVEGDCTLDELAQILVLSRNRFKE